MTQKATHVSHFNEPNPSVQSPLLGQGVRNAQLTCLQSPPLEACRVEEARQLGHQSGLQAEETPVPRPRFLDEEMPNPQRCSVVWVGKAGSKQEGEVGLETV